MATQANVVTATILLEFEGQIFRREDLNDRIEHYAWKGSLSEESVEEIYDNMWVRGYIEAAPQNGPRVRDGIQVAPNGLAFLQQARAAVARHGQSMASAARAHSNTQAPSSPGNLRQARRTARR